MMRAAHAVDSGLSRRGTVATDEHLLKQKPIRHGWRGVFLLVGTVAGAVVCLRISVQRGLSGNFKL